MTYPAECYVIIWSSDGSAYYVTENPNPNFYFRKRNRFKEYMLNRAILYFYSGLYLIPDPSLINIYQSVKVAALKNPKFFNSPNCTSTPWTYFKSFCWSIILDLKVAFLKNQQKITYLFHSRLKYKKSIQGWGTIVKLSQVWIG